MKKFQDCKSLLKTSIMIVVVVIVLAQSQLRAHGQGSYHHNVEQHVEVKVPFVVDTGGRVAVDIPDGNPQEVMSFEIPTGKIFQLQHLTVEVGSGGGISRPRVYIETHHTTGTTPVLHEETPVHFLDFQTGDGFINMSTELTLYSEDNIDLLIASVPNVLGVRVEATLTGLLHDN